jgi:hypothetical protein
MVHVMNKKSLTFTPCGIAIVGRGNCSSSVTPIPFQESVKVSPIVGDWSGILDIGMMKMTLILHIQQDPHEGLVTACRNLYKSATIYSNE